MPLRTVHKFSPTLPLGHVVLVGCLSLCGAGVLCAPAPKTIGFMGVLNSSSGQHQNGAATLTLSLYTTPTGGSPVWSEAQTVPVTNGLFTAALGSVKPLTGLDFSQQYYVGIKVQEDTEEMTPRIPLQGVPYALFAHDVATDASLLNKVSGGAISLSLAGETVDQKQESADTVCADQGETDIQTFTPSVSGSLVGLDLYLTLVGGTSPTGTLSVGVPGGAALSTQRFYVTSPGWRHFELATPVTVTAGTQYYWALTRSDGRIGTYGTAADTYPGGSASGCAIGDFTFRTEMASTGPPALAINTNVGIGTAAPQVPLQIVGYNAFPHLQISAGSTAPYGAFLSLDATATSGGNDWYVFSTGGTAGEGQGKLVVQDHSTAIDVLTLTKEGSVGIGTTSPGRALHVAPSSGIVIGQDEGQGGYTALVMDVSQPSGGYGEIQSIQASGLAYGNLALNPIAGNVGIGTGTPLSPLHIEHGGIGDGWSLRLENTSQPAYVAGIRASDSGYLEMSDKINDLNARFARLDSNGNWTAVSDQRAKDDIRPLSGILDKALSLQPVSFRYKGHPDSQIGFVAQDVEKEFPSLVVDGPLKSLNYAGLSVVAIGALREMEARHRTEMQAKESEMANLRARNESQQRENASLEARLKRLEERFNRTERGSHTGPLTRRGGKEMER